MTESAVDHTPLRDLYVALGEPIDKSNANGDWAVRLYYKPMMRLVWGGALLMALGGLLAVTDRRYRLARGHVAERTGAEAAICCACGICSRLCRSDEHTSELQSLMRRSYAFICLQNKINI